MCVSAIVAEESAPSNALFVDYANLPDAVPEFVFPHHFGMAEEVSRVRIAYSDAGNGCTDEAFFLLLLLCSPWCGALHGVVLVANSYRKAMQAAS